ncbi:MAG: phytanoyl-CoA dioxygenase family protein [Myxococcota bacterium]|nr:phytanoyl-CoA dioxygenase family protein [Myxococcota bacterium]
MDDEYRETGFRVRRGLVGPELIEALNERFHAIADGEVEPAPNLQVVRNVEIAKGYVEPETPAHGISKMNFIQNDPVMRRYAECPAILDEVEALIGHDLLAMNSMYLNKPPKVDGRHPLHQDLLYFPFRPADRIVGAWTALDRVTRENGCLVVIPGSHQGPLLEHDYPDWEHKNFLFVGAKGIDVERRVHLEMEPGDTVFFHPLLIHGSGFNKTDGLRRAFAVHFANANCEDIWEGRTESIGKIVPREDFRLVRGRDPHGYGAAPRAAD